MTELIFTTKLKFNGEVSDNEIETILKHVQELFVYGNDCGLIMPEDSDIKVDKLVLSTPKHLLIRELN